MEKVTRFLRYPGSKRRMLNFLMQHLPEGKKVGGRYIEPFVGSGAVYFSLLPREAILADINPDLVNLFNGIKKYPRGVWEEYCKYGETKEDYDRARSSRPRSLKSKAARVLFLNRTCFKGMWRTNKYGEFNVGYGGQERRWVISEKNLIDVSNALKKAEIVCSDFENTIKQAKKGDFIFLDPPYRPGACEEINEHYIGKNFRLEDQERLGKLLRKASRKNIRWAMTNTSHPDVLRIYHGCYQLALPMGTGRMPGKLVEDSGESLLTNYPIMGGGLIA